MTPALALELPLDEAVIDAVLEFELEPGLIDDGIDKTDTVENGRVKLGDDTILEGGGTIIVKVSVVEMARRRLLPPSIRTPHHNMVERYLRELM